MFTLKAVLRSRFGIKGSGIYVLYPDTEDRIKLAIGFSFTNYEAVAEAQKSAEAHMDISLHVFHNVVFLTDALSSLQSLQSYRSTKFNNLSLSLASFATLELIPLITRPLSFWQRNEDTERMSKFANYLEVETIVRPSRVANGQKNTHATAGLTPTTCRPEG